MSDRELEYFATVSIEEIEEFYKGYEDWLSEIEEEETREV